MFDIENHKLFRQHRYRKATITNPLFLGLATIEINPTELCNRTCSFCPRSNPVVYPNRNLNMSVDTAFTLAEQLKDYDGDIHITGFGEPTLNPNILEIISAFSNFYVEMITNGDRILSKQLDINDLEKAKLDYLIIDCYDNEEQVKQLEEILANTQIPIYIRKHFDTKQDFLIKEYNFNNRGGMMYDVEPVQRPCYLPFYKAFIDWNGDVGLCCNDWARKQKTFGNILKDNFSNIWLSKKFYKVRQELMLGNRKNLFACSNCSIDGTQQGKESFDLW